MNRNKFHVFNRPKLLVLPDLEQYLEYDVFKLQVGISVLLCDHPLSCVHQFHL